MRQALLIFVMSIIFACNVHENILNFTTMERYEYIGPNGKVDTLELHYKKDSLIGGLYRGVYKSSNNSLFFYSSPLVISKSNSEYDLVFKLDSLIIYKDEIQISNKSDSTIKPGISELPLFFSQSISFLGIFSDNELKITRTSGQNIFSSADDMVFKKVLSKKN